MMKQTVLSLLALTAFVAGAILDVPAEDQLLIQHDIPKEIVSKNPQRIVGGSLTTINQYPYAVALLFNNYGWTNTYTQWCGGTIVTSRAILSAAHCFETNFVWHNAAWWRARVGSSYANSRGTVHQIDLFVPHGSYNGRDYDIVVLHTATAISYIANTIAQGTIAGPSFFVPDNQAVWAIGWGATIMNGAPSEQLRHVQVWTINQTICRQRYGNNVVTDRMLCSGWLDVGGRDQCQGDDGGPLIYSGTVIGISSWGAGCAQAFYPGVNTRVSSFTQWVQAVINGF